MMVLGTNPDLPMVTQKHPHPFAVTWFLALVCWFGQFTARAEVNLWFTPQKGAVGHTTPEQGFSRLSPHEFDWAWVKEVALNDRQVDKNIVLNFLPGTYEDVYMGDTQWMKDGDPPPFTADPSAWSIKIRGVDPIADHTVFVFPSSYWFGDQGYIVLVQFVGNWKTGNLYRRIVVENLTLDGNWSEQEFARFDRVHSYKIMPLTVDATTARIRNVVVRNFGAHGAVPQLVTSPEGTEAFPIWVNTIDVGQEPVDGDPRPIVVEDCEVAGFHSVYGGYATAIAVGAFRRGNPVDPNHLREPFFSDESRRLALVRRCQVRGANQIAFGTAGNSVYASRGVTFTDNAAVGTVSGVNTDTGSISYIDIVNNLFFDVGVGLTHGVPNTPDRTAHNHFLVQNNSFRILNHPPGQLYSDFRYESGALVRDPTHITLGRPAPRLYAGIVFTGATSDTSALDNWFTTWPRPVTPSQSTLGAGKAAFRPVWKWGHLEAEPDVFPGMARAQSANVVLQNNSLSSSAFDFTGLHGFGGDGRFQDFDSATAPTHTRPQLQLARTFGSFNPTGTVERVILVTSNHPVSYQWLAMQSRPEAPIRRSLSVPNEPYLRGAIEVAIGVPVMTNQTLLRVPIRVALQPTPGNRESGTQVLSNQPVYMDVRLNGQAYGYQTLKTRADGIARGPVLLSDTNELVEITAWLDGPGGQPEKLDEYHDAWSRALWTRGTVVWLSTEPGVANLATHQRARLVAHRTGTDEQLRSSLSVRLSIETNNLPRAAVPGPGNDFQFLPIPPATFETGNRGISGVLQFAPGQREAILEVDAQGSSKREQRLLTIQINGGNPDDYVTAPVDHPQIPSNARILLLYP
jgi:hypothetical protein